MSYYRRAPRLKPQTISTEKVKATISRLDEIKDLTDWERSFIDSVKAGWTKFNSVTEKQHALIQKLADRYNPEKIAIRKEWSSSFDDSMREIMKIMSNYYKANPPYFQDLATRALTDDEYIPTERAYRAMCENKYARKVLETYNSTPLFPVGSMASVRNSAQAPYDLRGKNVLIIEHPTAVHTAARGAKRVKVLPAGGSEAIETEERWLKKLPKKLR